MAYRREWVQKKLKQRKTEEKPSILGYVAEIRDQSMLDDTTLATLRVGGLMIDSLVSSAERVVSAAQKPEGLEEANGDKAGSCC